MTHFIPHPGHGLPAPEGIALDAGTCLSLLDDRLTRVLEQRDRLAELLHRLESIGSEDEQGAWECERYVALTQTGHLVEEPI